MNKDYYKILGIEDKRDLKGEEFNKALKKAWRKIAIENHPDKLQGKTPEEKKKCEDFFKEASEAYDVLSDEKKRAEYDSPTSANFSFDDFNPFDIFSQGFGFSGFNERARKARQGKEAKRKGSSLRINLKFTLEECYTGGIKKIVYSRLKPCPHCQGKGFGNDGSIETCPTCNGSGVSVRKNGAWVVQETCPTCNGEGKIVKNPCPYCNGSGLESVKENVSINIPKGVTNGQSAIYNDMGHYPLRCDGINGDLIIIYEQIPHPIFERDYQDLYAKLSLSIIDSLLGCSKQIELLDKAKISVKVDELQKDGAMLRIKGKGLPKINGNGYGDLILVLEMKYPSKLSDKERELLSKLNEEENFKNIKD